MYPIVPPSTPPMAPDPLARTRHRPAAGAFAAGIAILLAGGAWMGVSLAAVPSAPHATLGAAPGVPPDLSPHATFQSFPGASGVDPYIAYTREPAPMGIADYGLSPGGTPYRYATPEFEGTLHLAVDHAYTDASNGQYTYVGNDVTFQLNVVLVLQNGGRQAQYWVQDALFLNSTAHRFIFGNNVWNFSSGSGGADQSDSVVGNGSVYYGVYEDLAAGGLPGNNVTLAYPLNVTTRVIASSIGGVPHVGLAYDDGHGFITYDNVSFPWTHGWTVVGFVVDGTSYNPLDIFDDAEWDYDGPAGGFHAQNIASNLTMGLSFWNGHNLQAVANAYDFGSDTAEATYNVSNTLAPASAGPTPQARLVNGTGSLGLLYDRTSIALVDVSAPTPNGTLWVDGTAVPFVGAAANLTLAAGNHTIELTNATGPVGTKDVVLSPGEYLRLVFAPRPLPQVLTVVDVGLPTSTLFGLTVNGTFSASTTGAVTFALLNGSYPYAVAPVAGWELIGPYLGTLTVNGSTTVTFDWREAAFPVSSVAVNLPSAVAWTISIEGTAYPGGAEAPVVSLPNGTYDYVVAVGITYLPEPDNGTFTIDGSAAVVTVEFGLDPGTLNGVVDPQNATVTVGGTAVAVTNGVFTVTETPGEYEVEATAPGYNATFQNITVTAGNTSVVNLELTLTPVGPRHPPTPTSPSGTGEAPVSLSLVFVAIVVVAAGAVTALLVRRARSRAPPRRHPRR